MMSEDNNMVALATPTRFLIESGEWNLTPNIGGSIHQEVNPFDCNFQQPIRTNNSVKNDKSSPPSPTVMNTTTTYYTQSPEPELNNTTPLTPPMSLSQSPSGTSTSFSLSSSSSSSPNMLQQQQQQQQHYVQQQQAEQPQQSTRRSSSRKQVQQQQNFFSEYLEDEEQQEYKLKTASVQSDRKRRIVFEGDDAEDRRKKFLERNRVAAYKCRQKKKNWMQELEQKAEIQNNQNDELRALVAQLKEESMYLRSLLLTHGNCDCDSVQAYLRKASAEITSNSSPTLMYSMSSRRSSMSTSFNAPPPPPLYHHHPSSSFSTASFPESSNTGLTPFLNTVINKPTTQQSASDPNDYFSQPHSNDTA